MARPRTPPPPIHLRSDRMLDVDTGEVMKPAELLINGDRIVEVAPTSVPADAVVLDLGDLTLLPGLMDMEVNLLLGGPDHASPLNAVQDDPALRTLPRRRQRPAHAAVGVHDRPQPRAVHPDRRAAPRRRPDEGDQLRVDRRPARRARRPRHLVPPVGISTPRCSRRSRRTSCR